MREAGCRRFTISDALILVAATAVGLAGAQGLEFTRRLMAYATRPELRTPERTIIAIWHGIDLFVLPCLMAWTLALLALRLRRPRPGRVRLGRQPGMMACVAVVAGLALGIIETAVEVLMAFAGNDFRGSFAGPAGAVSWQAKLSRLVLPWNFIVPYYFGTAVVVAWTVLAVSGRWRREPGWIDTAGIGLGLAWIGLSFAYLVYFT
jgi:hypothetical protein